MPEHLKKYTTEFVYLFNQIHQVANENPTDKNYHIYYNFGNNARKFLESYLFFRYPDHSVGKERKLEKFLGQDMGSVSFINRIHNELSHAESHMQRVRKPLDIPEVKKDAQLILDRIKNTDPIQYKYLCSGIGVDGTDGS